MGQIDNNKIDEKKFIVSFIWYMFKVFGVAAVIVLVFFSTMLITENKRLEKVNAVEHNINQHYKGEIVKVKGSFYYKWIEKYNDSLHLDTTKF